MHDKPQPIFIGGYMHSGTTLLLNILSSHQEIFGIPGETRIADYLSYFDRKWKNITNDSLTQNQIKELFKYSKIEDASLNSIVTNFLNGDIKIKAKPSFAFQTILSNLAKDNKYWLEKTPTNVYQYKRILDCFPGSKLILIHRDVRAVIASKKNRTLSVNSNRYRNDQLSQKRLEKDFNLLSDAIAWNKSINAMIKAKKYEPQRVFTIYYESLVSNPIEEINRLCDFLRIDAIPDMLNISNSNPGKIPQQSIKGIYTDNLDTWRSDLNNDELAFVDFISADKRRILGYGNAVSSNRIRSALMLPGQFLGILNRIFKRIKFFSPKDLFIYAKNFLKR